MSSTVVTGTGYGGARSHRFACGALRCGRTLLLPAEWHSPRMPRRPRPGLRRPSVEELAAQKPADNARETDTREAMCLMIELAARANGLPLEFFARVIWQESRFQSDAVGPVTRSGQRAQGIAQFMPGTASERRLLDPFDPVQALPKSAEFLHELREQFGNLGLAAAAYNAGPRRVQEWLAGVARCRRRRAAMSPPLPAPRSTTGPPPARTARCRPRAARQLPGADGLAQARAQFLCSELERT